MKSPTWSTNKTERNILKCCRHALHSFVKNQHLRPHSIFLHLGSLPKGQSILWTRIIRFIKSQYQFRVTHWAAIGKTIISSGLNWKPKFNERTTVQKKVSLKRREHYNIQNVWMNSHNQGIIQQFIYCHMAYCALAYLYYKIKHNID